LSQPEKEQLYQPPPTRYNTRLLSSESQRLLSKHMSFHAGISFFSKEVRGDQDRIKMYTHEFERDMTNKEGPGPAAFQFNVVPRPLAGQKFGKAARVLHVKKDTPGPNVYNLIRPLRSI